MEERISIITLGVRDLAKSIRFYRDGLGFATEASDDAQIAFFRTRGTRLALYPLDKLKEDISSEISLATRGFQGFTLAHNVREKNEVGVILKIAEAAGGKIEKEAQDVFWGGHSGYFSDPDGYYWEVAWSPNGKFNEDGSIVI
jgi:catechol 2,3-dioxygenase-like lactoylglutathione lyase family enzyme